MELEQDKYTIEILDQEPGDVMLTIARINGVVFRYETWASSGAGDSEWRLGREPESPVCAWPPDVLSVDDHDGTFDEVWDLALENYIPPPTPEDEVAELFEDAMFCQGIGGHLTCDEAEKFRTWLRSIGRSDAADVLIAGHSLGDDDPADRHHISRYDTVPPATWPSWVGLVKG